MTPDAKLRMRIYREGQCAYLQKAECPYIGWKAQLWEKGRKAAAAYYADLYTEAANPQEPQCYDLEAVCQRACKYLPTGMILSIQLEQGAGLVELYDGHGARVMLPDPTGTLSEQVIQALEVAIAHQTDN